MGSKISEKIDKMVTSMREELDKHDGSTIQTIYSNAKEGFANIRRSLSRSEKANKLADDIKQLGEDFVDAIKAGDKKLSAKILNGLEKKSKQYKKEKNGAEKTELAAKAAKPKNAEEKKQAAAQPKAPAASKARAKAKPKTSPKTAGKAESAKAAE